MVVDVRVWMFIEEGRRPKWWKVVNMHLVLGPCTPTGEL
jgi:hypothetical protein